MSIITNLLRLPASLAGVDLSDAAKRLDGALHAFGAKTAPVPAMVGYVEARLGTRAMAVTALESDRIARAVIAHVRVAPFFASLLLVVHPRPEIDAPICVVDLHVVPPGRASAYVDVCGPAITRPTFRKMFWEPLEKTLGVSAAMEIDPVPSWMAALSGGCGALVHARGQTGSRLFGLGLAYLDAYLHALEVAPMALNPAENRASAHAVADRVHAEGRAYPMLKRAFGVDAAARTTRFLWNQ